LKEEEKSDGAEKKTKPSTKCGEGVVVYKSVVQYTKLQMCVKYKIKQACEIQSCGSLDHFEVLTG